jgi:hypothetical protein
MVVVLVLLVAVSVMVMCVRTASAPCLIKTIVGSLAAIFGEKR